MKRVLLVPRTICVLTLANSFISNSFASGFSQQEFQSKIISIKRAQSRSENRLTRLGVSPSDFSSETKAASEEEEPKELFILHDTTKRRIAEAGKYLFGKLHNRLVVGGEEAPATVLLNGGQGIFSGLRVLGKARPSGTQERIAVDFTRLITREGTVVPLKGIGEDAAGASGLEAQVFSSKALAIAGAMGASFVSGLAASQQTQTPTAFGFSQVSPTGRNALLQGIAQTAADQSKRLIEDSTREKPVLVVEPDTEITIYLDEEVRL